jgi:hypothetical protein
MKVKMVENRSVQVRDLDAKWIWLGGGSDGRAIGLSGLSGWQAGLAGLAGLAGDRKREENTQEERGENWGRELPPFQRRQAELFISRARVRNNK